MKIISRGELKTAGGEEPPMNKALPYGVFVGDDGRETLYDRCYNPIVYREAGKAAIHPASGWIPHVEQWWFYDDSCSPRFDEEARLRCERAMLAFVTGKDVAPYVFAKHNLVVRSPSQRE